MPTHRPLRTALRWRRYSPSPLRHASTNKAPPPPRPYLPSPPEEDFPQQRQHQQPREPALEGDEPRPPPPPAPSPQKTRSWYRLFWPDSSSETQRRGPPDHARGVAASERVVKEGVLDPRYRADARRITAIVVAVPILVVTSWVLFQRRFMGVEQKTISKPEPVGAATGEDGERG